MSKKTQRLVVWIIIGVMLGGILLSVVGSILSGIYMS